MQRLKKFRTNSIVFYSAAIVVLGVIAPIALYSFISFKYLKATFTKSYHDNFNVLIAISEESITHALWNFAPESAEAMVKRLSQQEGIEEIIITDADNKVFIRSEAKVSTKEYMVASYDLKYEDRVVGKFIIHYSDEHQKIALAYHRNLIIWLSAIAAAVALVVTTIFINRRLVNPIFKLVYMAKKIKMGNLDSPIAKQRDDEIGFLAESLEHLRTSMKYYIDALQEHNKNLEKTVEEKTQALIESAKYSSLGIMASGIAHEINNPMCAIDLRVDDIHFMINDEKNKLDPTVHADLEENIGKLRKLVARVNKIVKSVRVFARDGEMDQFKDVNIKDCLQEALDILSFNIQDTNIKIESNLSDISVEASETQLLEVFVNLLSNAIQAISSTKDGWIKIYATETDSRVNIYFQDSGLGIAEEIRSKLFDPFFTTKEVGVGTGLGLSISFGIMEHHKGKIYYDANQSNTTFVVDIPKKQEKAHQTAA